MKITIEFDNKVLVYCLNDAHSRYWATEYEVFADDTGKITGYVIEHNGIRDKSQHVTHALDVSTGLQRLAKYSPKRFCELMRGDYNGVTGDILLQLSAGLMYQDGPKYGEKI